MGVSVVAVEDATNGGISSLLLNAKAGQNCGGIVRGMMCIVQSRDLKHPLAVRPGYYLPLSLLQDPRVKSALNCWHLTRWRQAVLKACILPLLETALWF